MSKSLTTLIANVQALLLDDGTRFTTATCTAAVRAALKEINQRAPVNQGTLIDAVTDQKDYELSDSPDAETAIDITDILLYSSTDDIHTPLDYQPYSEDERLFFRLKSPRVTGEYILARFTQPHTVSGLDSATESTIPAYFDDVLLDGACFWACQIRSVGRVETINLNQGVADSLRDAKIFFRQAFESGLAIMSRKRPQIAEERIPAWNDEWYGKSV